MKYVLNIHMKRICIVGCSWGEGVWGDPDQGGGIIDPGLGGFLENDGYYVVNVSTAGQSNYLGYHRLVSQEPVNFDYIIWFFTDPIRDLRSNNFEIFDSADINFEKILEIQHKLTVNAFENFNSLNKPIYCLGGTVKLDLELIKNYKNLIPIIPCITEFLEPTYVHPKLWQSDWINKIDKQFSLECLDKFLVEKNKQDNLRNYKKYFWPDGGHPNKLGHQKIYEKICLEVLNK